jgi:hypothetical protein
MTSKIEEGVLSFEAFKQVYISQVGSGTNFGDIVSATLRVSAPTKKPLAKLF